MLIAAVTFAQAAPGVVQGAPAITAAPLGDTPSIDKVYWRHWHHWHGHCGWWHGHRRCW
jgi:hypothetical protein